MCTFDINKNNLKSGYNYKEKILKNILMCPKQRTKKPGKGLFLKTKTWGS